MSDKKEDLGYINAADEFPIESFDKLELIAKKLHADDALSHDEIKVLEHPKAEEHFGKKYSTIKEKLAKLKAKLHL